MDCFVEMLLFFQVSVKERQSVFFAKEQRIDIHIP